MPHSALMPHSAFSISTHFIPSTHPQAWAQLSIPQVCHPGALVVYPCYWHQPNSLHCHSVRQAAPPPPPLSQTSQTHPSPGVCGNKGSFPVNMAPAEKLEALPVCLLKIVHLHHCCPQPKPHRRGQNWRLPTMSRLGKCLPQGPAAPAPRRLCLSWNQRSCIFPGACSFRHVYVFCDSLDHQAKDGALAPQDSIYKRPLRYIISSS